MYIEISRDLPTKDLAVFVQQYNLHDIGLYQLIKNKKPDSLQSLGWKLLATKADNFVIVKPLGGLDNFNNPSDKIAFTSKYDKSNLMPAVPSNVVFGYNRFKNKSAFYKRDSIITFFLRNNTKASKVMLAGSFNNWNPAALAMTKTDSGWIANVTLKPGKYWYKFIVDGNWRTDEDNQLRENDGRGNINSVYFRTNVHFAFSGKPGARRVYLAGSFNQWSERQLLMEKTPNSWQFDAYLAEGTHTYKFIADGDWFTDNTNPRRFPDEFGGYNSYISIGAPHQFVLNGYTTARQVLVSGNFNNWRKDELYMKKTGKGWELPYVLGAGNYSYKFLVDDKWIPDPANAITGADGNSFLIIGANYTFTFKSSKPVKSVYLAGDFNGWDPSSLPMQFTGSEWKCRVHLSPGKHLYKFIVDGNWIIDPSNKLWEQNEHGTGNSVIWIEE
jgi:1,4-alpha-glucan branching enzyme